MYYFDDELRQCLMGGSVSSMDLFDLWKVVDFKYLGLMDKSLRDSEVDSKLEDMYVDDVEEVCDEDMDCDYMEEFIEFDGNSLQHLYWGCGL